MTATELDLPLKDSKTARQQGLKTEKLNLSYGR